MGREKGKPTNQVWKNVRICGKESTTFGQNFKKMVE